MSCLAVSRVRGLAPQGAVKARTLRVAMRRYLPTMVEATVLKS